MTRDRRGQSRGSERDSASVAAREVVPRRAGLADMALWLQSSAGNARTSRALGLLRQPDPDRAPPPAPAAQVAPLANRVVDFTTAKATIAGAEVHASGRLVVSGRATVTDAALPAKAPPAAVATRAAELLVAALGAAAPTGSGTRLEVSLGGRPLVLELATIPAGPAFQVAGHFTIGGGTLSVPGVAVASATSPSTRRSGSRRPLRPPPRPRHRAPPRRLPPRLLPPRLLPPRLPPARSPLRERRPAPPRPRALRHPPRRGPGTRAWRATPSPAARRASGTPSRRPRGVEASA